MGGCRTDRDKASALSGDKNPGKELGLFEYIDEYNDTDTMVHQFIAECTGVFREGTNQDGSKNKRKDHYAMSFKRGRALNEGEIAKVEEMIAEVHEKTANPNAATEEPEQEAVQGRSEDDFDGAVDTAFEVYAPQDHEVKGF
jgi:hypothetical protein